MIWYWSRYNRDHFHFFTTLPKIRQHLAFICSYPHFPDHAPLLRLHYYAIIPRLLPITVIINDYPPPQGEQGHWGQGWKGGLSLTPPYWTPDGTQYSHMSWRNYLVGRVWQISAKFMLLSPISCYKIKIVMDSEGSNYLQIKSSGKEELGQNLSATS